MATQPIYTKLQNQEASKVLRPLGLTQVGRSRSWVDDHGWWIINVEFQPSGWSRGSCLNVGAQWLWMDSPHHRFQCGYRVVWPWDAPDDDLTVRWTQFITFESPEQFLPEPRLAELAGERVRSVRDELGDPARFAEQILTEGHISHSRFHAGVVCALTGRSGEERRLLLHAFHKNPKHRWGVAWNREVGILLSPTEDPIVHRLPRLLGFVPHEPGIFMCTFD